jgi:hypothetical protein
MVLPLVMFLTSAAGTAGTVIATRRGRSTRPSGRGRKAAAGARAQGATAERVPPAPPLPGKALELPPPKALAAGEPPPGMGTASDAAPAVTRRPPHPLDGEVPPGGPRRKALESEFPTHPLDAPM